MDLTIIYPKPDSIYLRGTIRFQDTVTDEACLLLPLAEYHLEQS